MEFNENVVLDGEVSIHLAEDLSPEALYPLGVNLRFVPAGADFEFEYLLSVQDVHNLIDGLQGAIRAIKAHYAETLHP